jgi:hypothetical protein
MWYGESFLTDSESAYDVADEKNSWESAAVPPVSQNFVFSVDKILASFITGEI